VTLPAFAAERRRMLHGAVPQRARSCQSIHLLPAGRSAANPQAADVDSIDGTDRRTDGHPTAT